MIQCPSCYPDREMTRHRVKYLTGEKESYYQLRCSRCGWERTIASYRMEDLKRTEKEYKETR